MTSPTTLVCTATDYFGRINNLPWCDGRHLLDPVPSLNRLHQPGNNPGDDGSLQREQIANSFLRSLGVPWLYRRFVAVYVNGSRRGTLMEDSQTPDNDLVKERFPNDTGGWLYKMQPWFEFGPAPTGNSIPFTNNAWCALNPFTTTGGVKKPARYRYNFEPKCMILLDFAPVMFHCRLGCG